jgi:hypothetical protein
MQPASSIEPILTSIANEVRITLDILATLTESWDSHCLLTYKKEEKKTIDVFPMLSELHEFLTTDVEAVNTFLLREWIPLAMQWMQNPLNPDLLAPWCKKLPYQEDHLIFRFVMSLSLYWARSKDWITTFQTDSPSPLRERAKKSLLEWYQRHPDGYSHTRECLKGFHATPEAPSEDDLPFVPPVDQWFYRLCDDPVRRQTVFFLLRNLMALLASIAMIQNAPAMKEGGPFPEQMMAMMAGMSGGAAPDSMMADLVKSQQQSYLQSVAQDKSVAEYAQLAKLLEAGMMGGAPVPPAAKK